MINYKLHKLPSMLNIIIIFQICQPTAEHKPCPFYAVLPCSTSKIHESKSEVVLNIKTKHYLTKLFRCLFWKYYENASYYS